MTTRAAVAAGTGQTELAERTEATLLHITEVLEGLTTRIAEPIRVVVPAAPATFKPPRFDGHGDVELFITHFGQVAEANNWPQATALLHLKESLTNEAHECTRADTLTGVLAALRARFGLSVEQALAKLEGLKRDPRTSLREHGTTVSKIVAASFPEQDLEFRETMALRKFRNTIGHAGLQRHLLSMQVHSVEEAIIAGEAYLAVPTQNNRSIWEPPHTTRGQLRQIDEEEDEVEVAALQPTPPLQLQLGETLQAILTRLTALEAAKDSIGRGSARSSPPAQKGKDKGATTCYKCGQEGHIARGCVKGQTTSQATNTKPSGNGNGPQ